MGAELARIEAGRGGRPLLLVHGFTGASVDFADHLDALAAAGWHAVAPDLPGHGQSHPAGFVFTFDAYADVLLELADDLGWDDFAIVGHSMGGVVVQHLAFRAPERLAAMVLMDTSPERFAIDADVVEVACQVVAADGMPALLALQKVLGTPLETDAGRRLREQRPGWVELQDSKLLQAAPDMYIAMARALTSAPSRVDALAQVMIPTLVLVGELDTLLFEPSLRLAAAIPGAELVISPGAGHSPQLEAPEAWRTAVMSFLTTLSSPTRGSAPSRPRPG